MASSVLAIADDKLILVHYMPWYASKPVSGKWGWHWTMNHFDPETIGQDGRREAAAHDYPLIGLYDSGDPDALECQVLLMKFSGIHGVVIDWYGFERFYDYLTLHRNTEKLIPWLKKAGLQFAICYEDQSIGAMVKAKVIEPDADLAMGKKVFAWLEENWFVDEAYLKTDQRPVFLVFGPQHFSGEQWKNLRSGVSSNPLMITLPHLSKKSGADGAFGWPPVTGGKTVSSADWKKYLEKLYARNELVIGAVFPGFHDIYEQAGLHDSYGHIDDRNGATFAETLDLALKGDARLIQIATWNDYGEGTAIEPTRNHEYRYLSQIQRNVAAASQFTPGDLRLPVRLYQLRKLSVNFPDLRAKLDDVSAFLFAAKCAEAGAALEQVESLLHPQ